jgi:hypothetical protein
MLVPIARVGDGRQRNCKTAALRARDVYQVAAESANQRARDIESEAGRFRAWLEGLEQTLRRGDSGSGIFHAHHHTARFDRCGNRENLWFGGLHRASAIFRQIEKNP